MPGWGAQKPPMGVGIDWGHPLANRLAAFVAFQEMGSRRVSDLVRGISAAIDPTLTWLPNRNGTTLTNPTPYNGSTMIALPRLPMVALQPFTVFARAASLAPAYSGFPQIISTCHSDSSGAYGFRLAFASTHYIRFGIGSSSGYASITDATAVSDDGAMHTFVGVYQGGTGGITRLYRDGRQVAQGTATLAPSVNTLGLFNTSTEATGRSANYNWPGLIDCAGVWNQALLPSEVATFTAQPYCMFESGDVGVYGSTNRRRRLLCGAA